MRTPRALFLAAALAFMTLPAAAAELRLGVQVEPTSIDPHFANVDTNNAMALHFFTPLVIRNEKLEPQPGLATAWKMLDDTTWEFALRRGVKFHDGSEMTAEDVKFSIERAPNIPNSPSPLSVYLRQVTGVEIVDPYTVRVKTSEIFPLMPISMGTFVIVSKKATEGKTTDDFNAGRAMVGTGPFKFVEWARGERIVMERFDGFWGEKPEFDKVTFRFIPTAASRSAALLAGDVDLIDFLPTQNLPAVEARPEFRTLKGVTNRLIYLSIEHERANAPGVTDKAGKPYTEKGPLQDVRVRRAISKAIDRRGIAQRIMEGASAPTGQIMPEGFYGYTPDIPVEPYDPEGARKLLAEAGYPNGFVITMHVPRNRYVGDVRAMESIAQMLARIGIEAKLEIVPVQNFFTRGTNREFSLFMIGFGVVTGEPSSYMSLVLQTYDEKKKQGGGNRNRYSNPQFDAMIDKAVMIADDKQREAALQEATRLAILKDQAIIPLHHQVHIWGMKKNLTTVARTDEYTLAQDVKTVK